MLEAEAMVLPAEALAEVKAHLRVGHGEEDALIGGMARSAAELCERFTGMAIVARDHAELLAPRAAWTRLGAAPVRAIGAVEALDGSGAAAPLPPAAYAIDIDAGGRGWTRVTDAGGARRVRVRYTAGLAAAWSEIPDALRHGIVRLAAHLYMDRQGAAAPPAAVAALWRPWRRVGL